MTHRLRLLLCLLPLLLPACTATRPPIDIPFAIQSVNRETPRPSSWPVEGGIPLYRGAAFDPAELQIVRNDVAVAAQFEVTSRWYADDRSIRWVTARFLSDGTGEYRLVRRRGGKSPAPDRPVRVQQAEDRVTVTTGRLAFTVRKDRFSFLDELSLDGKPVLATPAELTAQVVGSRYTTRDERTMKHTSLRGGDGYKVVVEEDGPVCAVIRIEGKLFGQNGGWYYSQSNPYILRIYAYAGQPYLRLDYRWIWDLAPELSQMKSLGLVLHTRFADSAGRSEFHVMDNDDLPRWPMFDQYDPRYRIYHDQTNFVVAAKERNWASIDTDQGGVLSVVRDAAKLYPKGFSIEPASGTFTTWLWPPLHSGRLMDLRGISDRWPVGLDEYLCSSEGQRHLPPEAPAGVPVTAGGLGVSRLHTIWIMPYASKPDPAVVAGMSAAADDPWMIVPSPEYMCATEAAGGLMLPQMKAMPVRTAGDQRPENYDCLLADEVEWLDRHRTDWFHWYGFLEHGNTQRYFGVIPWFDKLADPDKWWNYRTKWGWINGEHFAVKGLWQQFARTGDPKVYRFAELYAKNMEDVVTVWAGDHKGWQHRHSPDIYGDYSAPDHTYSSDRTLHYVFSGDNSARDGILMTADVVLNMGSPKAFFSGDFSRRNVLAYYAVFCAWTITGEARYRQYLDEVLDMLADPANDRAIPDESFMYCSYIPPFLAEWYAFEHTDATRKVFSRVLKKGIDQRFHLEAWAGPQADVAALYYLTCGDEAHLRQVMPFLSFHGRLPEIRRDSFHQVDSLGADLRMYPLCYYALVKAGLVQRVR
jgi:hypothetical protein